MRHEHLVVTVESGIKAHIEEDLDPGETVEAWVADAIDAKLATEEAVGAEDGRTGREEAGASDAIRADDEIELGDEVVDRGDDETKIDGNDGPTTDDNDGADDDYDEGFEYVDDCAI